MRSFSNGSAYRAPWPWRDGSIHAAGGRGVFILAAPGDGVKRSVTTTTLFLGMAGNAAGAHCRANSCPTERSPGPPGVASDTREPTFFVPIEDEALHHHPAAASAARHERTL